MDKLQSIREQRAESREQRAERDNCYFVKVVLMVLVVLGHATHLWCTGGWFNQAPEDESVILRYFTDWIGSFHIYAFALVSGYIFAYMRYEKNRYRKFGAFIKTKTRRLIVPYLFAAVVWVAPWHAFYFDVTPMIMIRKFILGEGPAQLWFLLMLFMVFMLMYFLADLMYGKLAVGIIFSLGTYGVSLIGNKFIPNFFQIWTACGYLSIFYLGMVLRKYKGGCSQRCL